MDERKRQVLQAIIDDYISTAEPIGSRTIARKCGLGVSPATIRNEMSDLEALGFLEQPHASAGRIPSAKGYRFYVDCLMGPQQLSERDAQLINQWFDQKVRRLDEAEKGFQFLMRPVIKRIADALGNGFRPLEEFFLIRRIAGYIAFFHAAGPHGPPFVMVAAEPDFGDVAIFLIAGNFGRVQMAMEIKNRHGLGIIFIQCFGSGIGQ